ncbi:tetratricopeptide repeat protein [Streptomyces sp. ZAF1911]|uniref:tetratricopeptide repeat protein n=1 Tax=Streptomyces sp. ZAF1911 TaxID=2944129 RepID=UPI00237A7EFE|nr:tetratricopeptide repeat protein [Streptomyces sp. ZAF1911]MDD9381379.1 tetratricopeptide repeat protein [Streptomyces sp. ZAF1911]
MSEGSEEQQRPKAEPGPESAPGRAAPAEGRSWQQVVRSGSAQADRGGFANSGIYDASVHLPKEALRPPAEVPAPTGISNVPQAPRFFVGREQDLARLDAALRNPGAALVQAVHGLGGIGKSTLAAHWASTHGHGCYPVRWITADSVAGVRQGLADLATALQPALSSALSVEGLAEYALQWLAGHENWLVVLDNVEDPADVAPLIARAPGGRFLITSRLATAWTDTGTLVRLDTLHREEAVDLLTRTMLASGERDLDGAAEVCEELGHLPLAIEQAGAYLAQSPLLTPRGYLELLTAYPAAMYGYGGATTDGRHTIARVWRVTLDRLQDRRPLAVEMLFTVAWFGPDGIPAAALTNLGPPPEVHPAIGLLAAYGLVTPDPSTGSLSLHRLLQAVARTADGEDPHRTADRIERARKQAAEQLLALAPADGRSSWPAWRRLMPHVEALAGHASADTDTVTMAALLHSAAVVLNAQGMGVQAIPLLERAITARTRLLGKDHPDSLESCGVLGQACHLAGDLLRAFDLLKQDADDCRRLFGDEDPETLTARSNLASVLQDMGYDDEAIEIFGEVLEASERQRGRQAPETEKVRDSLAWAYMTAGRAEHAVQMRQKVLAERTAALGADHPDLIDLRGKLAFAHLAISEDEEAVALYTRALEDAERILGDDHPTTISARQDLAGILHRLPDRDPARILALLERALADCERVYGPGRTETTAARAQLAASCGFFGDHRRAVHLYQEVLAAAVQEFGDIHPEVIDSRRKLARAHAAAGGQRESLALDERVLADQLRLMGEDHEDTLGARETLAVMYERLGDPGRAVEQLQIVLAAQERTGKTFSAMRTEKKIRKLRDRM